ncbi:MAG: hypothetical protein R2764_10345 [Bacteroidales bacterium]
MTQWAKLLFQNVKTRYRNKVSFLRPVLNGYYASRIMDFIVRKQKAKIAATGLRPPKERTKDLKFLKELMEAGKNKTGY